MYKSYNIIQINNVSYAFIYRNEGGVKKARLMRKQSAYQIR